MHQGIITCYQHSNKAFMELGGIQNHLYEEFVYLIWFLKLYRVSQ